MNQESRVLLAVRWTARVGALLAAGFIALFFVGDLLSDGGAGLMSLDLRESLMMAAFGAVFAGLLAGWRWELAGGLLVVGGMVVFYLLDYALSGSFPRGPFFLLIALPGALYLLAAALSPGRGMPR